MSGRPGPAPSSRGLSLSRQAAAAVLLRVEEDPDSDSGELLDEWIENKALAPNDARLATALVFTTLRNELLLDEQYRSFLKHPPEKLRPPTRVIFRLAAAQRLLFERLPAHAIANESVELARRQFRLPAWEAGFVNAVVRKITALEQLTPPRQNLPAQKRLSLLYSHPEWLVKLFGEKFGKEKLEAVLSRDNEEPRATLRVNTLRMSLEQAEQALADLGVETQRGALAPEALILTEPGSMHQVVKSDLFAQGAVYAQDEASQLIALLADPRPGERILDLCAAPGGKTTHMAQRSGGKASISATDISAPRLETLRSNIERLHVPGVEVRPYQEVVDQLAKESCDLVLVDAPCSGLGTLRRNPEIRYRCSTRSIERLASQQLEVLALAGRFVAPGGRLLYSTCTVTQAENRGTIEAFLAAHTGFEIVCTPSGFTPLAGLMDEDGFYRTWPHHLEMDGFEAVLLRRKA